MKINSIAQHNNNINFNGSLMDKTADFLVKHPKLPYLAAGLAGSSVIAQKIVMSGSEATIGPAMDIAIGKAITNVTNEKDGRTNQSSKVQAVRTFSQSVGGTITGIIIRGACIAASTYALAKVGEKAGSKIGELVTNGTTKEANSYEFAQKTAAWGKNLGGAVAVFVMMFTNFLIDAPFINWINKKATDFIENKTGKKISESSKEAE